MKPVTYPFSFNISIQQDVLQLLANLNKNIWCGIFLKTKILFKNFQALDGEYEKKSFQALDN